MTSKPKPPNLRKITALFDMRADFVHGFPYGSGHINDTYCVTFDQAGQRIRYVLQRINTHVFKDPHALMKNISRVTHHSLGRLLADEHPEAYRRTLTCIPAQDGNAFAFDPHGNAWRTYPLIERARSYDLIETNEQAFQVAKAFGNFQKLVADIGGERLHETIPDFHHTPKRLDALRVAIETDPCNRAAEVKNLIDFALSRSSDCARITDLIASGDIPERVTHNDTKLNNVLLDDVTAEGVCVVDLDTTMPGSSLYDFGDMIRSGTPSALEDDTEISTHDVRLDRFDAFARGYLEATNSFLNTTEIANLAFSGKLLTLECGIRFLTDYLQGDTYFKIKHPSHNLDRCRNQFAFVQALERNLPKMETIVRGYADTI